MTKKKEKIYKTLKIQEIQEKVLKKANFLPEVDLIFEYPLDYT